MEEEAKVEDVWHGLQQQWEREAWPRRASRPVVVAGEEESSDAASERRRDGKGTEHDRRRPRGAQGLRGSELKGCGGGSRARGEDNAKRR